ncbi:MAG: 2OG-Fe(II) oxygenase [Elusimicrobiota bacterium]
MQIHNEGPDIFSFELFSPRICAGIIKEISQKKRRWKSGPLTWSDDYRAVVNSADRRADQLSLKSIPSLEKIYCDAVGATAQPAARLCWEYRVFRFAEQGSVIRYDRGGHFRTHIDAAGGYFGGRVISLVCYLNSDFKGGRTFFPRQNVRIEPVTGKAILFPAGITHPHAAQKVSAGRKFVLVDWLS